jgi:hypothetical protein
MLPKPEFWHMVTVLRPPRSSPGRAESYDDIIRVLVKDGRFGAVDVTGVPWTEVDFPADVDYAIRVILPALELSARPGHRRRKGAS